MRACSEAVDLEVDESSLTGESLPVPKQMEATPAAAVADRACMLHATTTVVSGKAVAVVTAVGAQTQSHRAVHASQARGAQVGLQSQLRDLTNRAWPLSLAGGALVTGLGLLRLTGLRQAVSSGVAVSVAAVPEGLPLVATLAQQASARRLTRAGALVRAPRSVEALGRVDVVCFDKTGTLSENRLRVARVEAATARPTRMFCDTPVARRLRPTVSATNTRPTSQSPRPPATAARRAPTPRRCTYRSGRGDRFPPPSVADSCPSKARPKSCSLAVAVTGRRCSARSARWRPTVCGSSPSRTGS